MLLLILGSNIATAMAQEVGVRRDAPQRYTVTQGDTLWGIAGRFLESPWQWSQVWQDNPQIRDPQRIYPGDSVALSYTQGAPRLHLERGPGEVVRLSPGIRRVPHREAIATIPLEEIEPFLQDYRVIEADSLPALGHVVAGDNRRIISGAGDRLYARGNFTGQRALLGIYREGQRYVDAASGERLGLELQTIGQAQLVKMQGDVAVLEVRKASQEIRSGDIILPLPANPIDTRFQPRAPATAVNGRVLAIPGGVKFIGRLDVVALDRGALDGLSPGHVLGVAQVGEQVIDPLSGDTLQLPEQEAGLVMVFRTFERVSYALVMQARLPLSVGDRVHRPEAEENFVARGTR
ncbi:LysM peptidoglycan-binding domain-containing protein [Halomonas sp. WWR20]